MIRPVVLGIPKANRNRNYNNKSIRKLLLGLEMRIQAHVGFLFSKNYVRFYLQYKGVCMHIVGNKCLRVLEDKYEPYQS